MPCHVAWSPRCVCHPAALRRACHAGMLCMLHMLWCEPLEGHRAAPVPPTPPVGANQGVAAHPAGHDVLCCVNSRAAPVLPTSPAGANQGVAAHSAGHCGHGVRDAVRPLAAPRPRAAAHARGHRLPGRHGHGAPCEHALLLALNAVCLAALPGFRVHVLVARCTAHVWVPTPVASASLGGPDASHWIVYHCAPAVAQQTLHAQSSPSCHASLACMQIRPIHEL